jgi:NAD-dependent dihydropyrimidine dehydrogenase PreA subunit/DNA-binding Lrp family transcriptional regulator
MAERDYYEDLCKFYEFAVGEIPNRNEFKEALQKTIAAEDLGVFFLLPPSGNITLTKLEKKAKIPPDELRGKLKRLASEGFIRAYKTKSGYTYERGNIVFMTEQQVRKKEETPQRTFFARFFNNLIEGKAGVAVPTKTPHFRAVPAEPAIIKSSELRTIDINVVIPYLRGVLPIDIVTEMVRKQGALIGVAECFCRRTKKILGEMDESSHHPLETCFSFNEQAETLIEHGFARKIDYDEMIAILKDCEARGFIHNVDNCRRQIQTLCNCCSCCCVLIKSIMRGETHVVASSRYMVNFDVERCENCKTCVTRCPINTRSVIYEKVVVDTDRCIGCGLCATTCPTGASKMVLRKKTRKIPRSYTELNKKLVREVVVSFAKRKISKISKKITGLMPKHSWYKPRR